MSQIDLLHDYATTRDADAFAKIVTQYQRLILATCRRLLRRPEDADDAVQETFLRLAQKAGEVRTNLGGWLHGCAVNVARDINRRRTTRARHESAAAAASVGGDDPQRDLAELREHLDAALEKLAPEQRELIIERFFAGRTQLDLAAEAGVSPSTLSNRLDHAIERLRDHLGGSACAAVALSGLLEAEHLSAVVPGTLTANIMKIGLSGAPRVGAATATGASLLPLALKVFAGLAVVAVLAVGVRVATGPRNKPTPGPAVAAVSDVTITSNAILAAAQTPVPPRWQTTQPAGAAANSVLSGRVVDRTGKPIANATITLAGPVYQNAKTDADGNYTFATLPRAGEYRVGVEADGFIGVEPYVSREPGLNLTPQSHARREMVLDRGVTVNVTVTDAAGEPFKGASIDANVRSDERRYNGNRRQITDDLGRVALTLPVSTAPYVIAATADGCEPVRELVTPKSVDTPQDVKLMLLPGLKVKGVAICNDGKPATGWSIVARPEWWSSNYVPRGALIDQEGNFTLNDVGSGSYTLDISMPMGEGMSTSHQVATLVFPPKEQPIRLNIPHASPASQVRFTGRVKFVGGPKPDSVTVQAFSADNREFFHSNVQMDGGRARAPRRAGTRPAAPTVPPTSAPGKDEGIFTFEAIPAGVYRISFESTAIEPKHFDNVKIPGDFPLVELKVVGKPHLTGTVVDAATGKPIPQFAVRTRKVQSIGEGPNYVQDARWLQVSNPDGKFDVELVGPGIYQVQASIEGYAWIWSPQVRVESGGSKPNIALKATSGGTLNGTVLDPAGKPLANAKVIPLSMARTVAMRGEDRFEGDAGAVTTDSAGRFAVSHLAAGDETLKVTHADFAPLVSGKVKVIEGQSADAGKLQVRAGGAVEGVVFDAMGKPSAGVSLQFQDESGYGGGGDEIAGRLAETTTDDAGHFKVEHLPAGQITYVNLGERWNRKGVVRRVIRPVEGKTTHLDFGGATPTVKGRLLSPGGKALANAPVQLSFQSQWFGAVMTTASTDSDGRFTFFGPPRGRYTLYMQDPAQGREWMRVKDVDVAADHDSDLGDIAGEVGDLIITIAADDSADAKEIRFVSVQLERTSSVWRDHIGQAQPIDGGKYRAKLVPPGKYRVVAALGERASINAAVERKPGAAETAVTLRIPRSSATLTVTTPKQSLAADELRPEQSFMFLRSDAGTTEATFASAASSDKPPPSRKLPPGTYRFLDTMTGRPRADVAAIELKDGETKTVEVSPVPAAAADGTSPLTVQLCLWTSDGVLITDAKATLTDATGAPAGEPGGDAGLGSLLRVRPGHYRAKVDRPGAASPAQTLDVDIAASSDPSKRSRWNIVHLTVP